MKRILLATVAGALVATGAAWAEPVNVGIILGFTGPLELITPEMARQRRTRLQGGVRLRQASRRHHPQPRPRRLDLHRRRRRDRRGDEPRHRPERRRHRRRRLLGRHHRHRQQRRDSERRRDDLAVRHLAGAHDDQGRRLLLPRGALRRAPGRDPRPGDQGGRDRQHRDHLHQQRLRKGLGGRAFHRLRGGWRYDRDQRGARGRQGRLFRRGRRAPGLRRPGARRARLCRPGRRRHRPGLARHRRLRQVLLRRRHVRPEPDRQDRRRDQRQGHRHPAGHRRHEHGKVHRAQQGRRLRPDRHLRAREPTTPRR